MFRDISRKKQSLSREECIHILINEKRGVLSVIGDDGYPYGMPINHFYSEEDGKIYFHTGKTGHRTDALRKCNKVSFCVYDSGYRKNGHWALNIKSVIVFGRTEFIEDHQKSIEICKRLSYKCTDDKEYIENETAQFGRAVLVFALTPEHITGKTVNES